MMRFCTTAIVLLALAVPVAAEWDPAVREGVLSAFNTLATSEDTVAAGFLTDTVVAGDVSAEDWNAVMVDYLDAGGRSTAVHVSYWNFALSQAEGAARQRIGETAVIWGLTSVLHGAADPAADPSFQHGFDLLAGLAPEMGSTLRMSAFNRLHEGLRGEPINQLIGSTDAGSYSAWIQMAVGLRALAPSSVTGRMALADLLRLESQARAFWDQTGMLLFDQGQAGQGHVRILSGILGATPPGLHNLVGVVIGGGASTRALSIGDAVRSRLLLVPGIPLDQPSEPDEFPVELGSPVVPAFNVAVAEELVAAIQHAQLPARPELVIRRDLMMGNMGGESAGYLRNADIVSPDIYFNDPDTLLPSVGALWFMDTVAAFELAGMKLKSGWPWAVEQFLLMADLMSGGGSTTPLYLTDEQGNVQRADAPVGRRVVNADLHTLRPASGALIVDVPESIQVLNAIEVNGEPFVFDWNSPQMTTEFGGRIE